MKKFKIFGSRIIKTGIAVFITSLICHWLGWPAVFAVITAIVTVEPTVSDSIRKGIVRFPASAIGSAYAVLFIYLFGNSPITYTAAALFTIITCFKLKLHDGLLVATLTSVAMIEVIHSNFIISFFIRLGTTSIGLLVSTAVNMFVLPPNYSKRILTNIHSMLKTTGSELESILKLIIEGTSTKHNEATIRATFAQLKRKLDRTDMLIRFQKEEMKYHRLDKQARTIFNNEQEMMKDLRLIHYHIGNLINTPLEDVSWSEEDRKKIIATVETISDAMKHPDHFSIKEHQKAVREIMEQFWDNKKRTTNQSNSETATFFSAEIIILYELLSIYNIVEDLLTRE
ncbi:aromatic acid exporter family protein [Aquibacillus sediminis]|uniref:aromatic acid exporter family protein n=1 Tax=Aquibacillus sediminis TaxID=2574734 RepID=UPI001108EDB8|nr:aromatic acid exporter family protein [Aquibacillus sediminis]